MKGRSARVFAFFLVFSAAVLGAWFAVDAGRFAYSPSSIFAYACGSGGCVPLPPSCSMHASPTSVNSGGSSTVYWDSDNTVSGSIDHGIGSLGGAAGSVPVYNLTQTTTFTGTFYNAANKSVQCSTTIVVNTPPPPPPPPQNGCIQIVKETYDTNSNPLTPIAQFSFTLDGGTTIQNDAAGHATFSNVTPGTHTVTEGNAGATWTMLSVTPSGGNVVVSAGPTCAAVVFKNKQVVQPPANGCIAVHKQTLDTNGNNLMPVAQFSFQLDGGATVQNDASGNAIFSNVSPGTHTVTELSAGSTWTLTSISVPSGQVTVASGSSCAPITFVNQQVVTPPPPSAPACTLSANPNSFSSTPGATTLTWTTTGTVTSATLDHSIGAVTPASGGSLPNVPVPASTTFILTVTGPGGTSTCSVPVTVTIPPPPGPSCTLSLNTQNISTGGSAVLSWTSSNVTSGLIDNNVGAASIPSGSTTVFPPSSTTYHAAFNGPNGTVTCSVPITVSTPSCVSGCGGGGLDQPTVALFQNPMEQPLAFVSLAEIPYTGFEAGPALTMIFWLAVGLLSALAAYVVVGKGTMRTALAYVIGGVAGLPTSGGEDPRREHPGYGRDYPMSDAEEARGSGISASIAAPAAVLPAAALAPVLQPASEVRAAGSTLDIVETRAHAAGVLMSPEAASLAAALAPGREETLDRFGMILDDAVHSIPREDGWIMLTADKLREISVRYVPPTPQALSLATDGASAKAFAVTVLSGDREKAFTLIRELELGGAKPTALMAATATLLDQLYRAKKGAPVSADEDLIARAANLSPEQLERLVTVFAHSLDHLYASPFTGAKLALAQAFEIVG